MFHTDEEVIEAMGPRETVGRAIELLCAKHDVGEDIAFAMLVHGSSDSIEQVRHVAADIIRQSTGYHDNL